MKTLIDILDIVGQLAGLLALLLVGRFRSEQKNLPRWMKFIQAGMHAIAPDKIEAPTAPAPAAPGAMGRIKRETSRGRLDTPPPFPVVLISATEAVPAPVGDDE
jgi:hypothetical protein